MATHAYAGNKRLEKLLKLAADKAVDIDGITRDMLDDNPGGNIHRWCLANCNFNPEQTFFVIVTVCAAIADRLAQDEGYFDQADRAAKLMMERRILAG